MHATNLNVRYQKCLNILIVVCGADCSICVIVLSLMLEGCFYLSNIFLPL